jgi:hypothetical protein
MHPEHRSIGELAYRLWQARGCPEGGAERDWLEAEKQLRSAQGAPDPTASDAMDAALKATFPASDPPASQRADVPPANADAKWKAAAASRKGPAVARSRPANSAPGEPSAKPPG